MLLAFKINAFANRPNLFEHAVGVIRQAGFKGIGLVFDKPFLWLDDLSRERTRAILKLLEQSGLTVADVSTCTASGYNRPDDDYTPPGQRFGPSFTSRDPDERQLRVDHTKKVIDFALELGCHYIDTSTGYQPEGMDHATAWGYTRDCLADICEYAEKMNVSVNIEYEPGEFGPGGIFVGDASSALSMCNDVGSLALGVNLDVIHSEVCGEDIPTTCRILGDRLRVVEFDDMKSERDENGILRKRHFHLVPGDGEINYHPILEALEEIRFQGPIIVELYSLYDKNPEEACERTFTYLTKYFQKYFD